MGIKAASADFSTRSATIEFDPDSVTLVQIKNALLNAGYVAGPIVSPKQNSFFSPRSNGKQEFQGNDRVCFCFGFTKKDIEQDYLANGKSTISEKIMAEKKAGGCDCTTKNPRGR